MHASEHHSDARCVRFCRWAIARACLFAIVVQPGSALVGFESARDELTGTSDLRRQTIQRRPVALARLGSQLFVANSASGTVSVLDADSGAVLDEFRTGGRLTDLTALNDGARLLLTDAGGERLVLVEASSGIGKITASLSIRGEPVSVRVSRDQRFCSVASLWAHRLTLVSIETSGQGDKLTARRQIDLPFAPRQQCLAPDGAWLFVADAFGGHLAVIATAAGQLASISRFDGHNIRGLMLDEARGELLVAHQLLDEQIATTASHVSWGGVLSNVLRSIPLTELLPPNEIEAAERAIPRTLAHWSLDPLGKTGDGLGDPSALLALPGGRIAVALGGVDRIVWRGDKSHQFNRRAVGSHPVALAADPAGNRVFVANRLDDSISIVPLENGSVPATVLLGPMPEPTSADRGERLFYDARLSLHGWYSCHSCHTDGHSCGLLNDNFGDGSFGFPKRIPSLLGTAGTGPWAWNGSQPALAGQVRSSLMNTMHGPPDGASDRNVADLEAHLDTLSAPPGVGRARNETTSDRGAQLFKELNCASCHAGPRFTSAATYDVSIHDPQGETNFNPPSLLGVSQRGSYFHDSRARTLRDVFERFHHGETNGLMPRDIDALV